MLVAATACGVPERPATFVADEDVPFGLLAPTTTAVPAATGPRPRRTDVCFVRGPHVVPLPRDVAPDPTAGSVDALERGPTPEEAAAGYRTALLSEDAVRVVMVSGGVAHVELTPGLAEGGTADTTLALAQLVCTLTSQPGVGQVDFTLDGRRVDVPLADGSLASRPVTREDYSSLIAGTDG